MAFSDYSTTPGSNTSIAGTNVGEGCPPGNINNAIRQLAADGKALSDQVAGIAAGMPVGGGIFTGAISRQGQGAYLNHADPSFATGPVYFLADGSGRPTPSEGLIVFYYT